MASGKAKAIACHEGLVPSDVPIVSACGEKRTAKPTPTSRSCVTRSRTGTTMQRVDRRSAEGARERDQHDRAHRDEDVPRLAAQRVHVQRRRQVVRHEERREGDDDQVVEEERPAREEAGEVVEGDPDERRRAARLPDRGRPFGVRKRDEQEEEADEPEHERREAERVQGDDPEREVDRGGDLTVGDRGQRRGVEDTLEPRQLPGHLGRRLTPPQEVEPADAEGDEERPEHEAERPAAAERRHHEQREAEPDEDDREDGDAEPVDPHAALGAAATMTRQGACLSTKSTVPPKIVPWPPRPFLGAPMTMISACRRSASSTIARPAWRARTRRPLTSTPYESPIARASSRRALARSSSPGSRASSGSSSGTSITLTAAIDAPRSAASRHARSTASSDSSASETGTRMLRYSSAIAGPTGSGARTVSTSRAWTNRLRNRA